MNEQEKEVVKAHMQSILRMSSEERESFIARTIGDVYDEEMPINRVVEAVSRFERADVGEHIFYLTPDSITKEVLTLTSNCSVTQEKVTPNTRTELTFTDLISKEYYVCIQDWLRGDHDVIRFYADAIIEAMDRQEIFAVLALIDAGATASSNLFTLDSGKTEFDYPKLIEMRKAVRRFGSKLVLITGCNVTNDIDLMDFTQDTNRPFTIDRIVDEWISIEDYEVDVNGSTEKVIDPDVAYLVAVSDSKGNMPVLFSRRKTSDVASEMSDTTAVAKERLIVDGGLGFNRDTANGGDGRRKLARAKVGYQEYGAVLLNNKVVAKFDLTP